jgi:hypothetical protein
MVTSSSAEASVYQDTTRSTQYQRWYLNPADGICNSADEPPNPIANSCSGGNSLRAGESCRMVNVNARTRGYGGNREGD